MTYFAMALQQEAKTLISFLKLTLVKQSPFSIYANDNYILVITGMGGHKALMATTHLLTLYPPSAQDILINYGIAGATKDYDIGEMLVALSLTHKDKTYYPDMRLNHPFNEVGLHTVDEVLDEVTEAIFCVDMEAFYVYEAGLLFLKSSQILTFKVVSDHFSKTIPSKEDVNTWMGSHLEILFALLQNHQSKLPQTLKFSTTLQKEIDKTIEVLKLTVSQVNQFNDRLKGYILKHQKEPLLPKHLPEFTQHKKEQKDAFNKLIILLAS